MVLGTGGLNMKVRSFVAVAATVLAAPSNNGLWSGNLTLTYTYSETPLPSAPPLFATGLGALGLLG